MKRNVSVKLEDGESYDLVMESSERLHSLADLLAARGFPLNTRCGQRGLCHGCEVILPEGEIRRACQETTAGGLPSMLRIPARSRMENRPQVSETFRIDTLFAHDPLFALQAERDTAFAVDVGTTTVAVLLVDIATGEAVARAGAFNAQIRFGDNVLTRIDGARSEDALASMQAAAVGETIGPLLVKACQRAGRAPSRLAGGVVAGNTTMLHLVAGEDPSSLGVAPFTPRFLEGRRLRAASIGLTADSNGDALSPDTPLQLLPGIAAYIGADIVAGIHATGMLFDPLPSLLIDIGTNGEIVLQNEGRLTACATAAGPAFEGCGLQCGTRAREGAISGLELALDPFRIEVKTIGDVPSAGAKGICGSAYVDFLAVGRRFGLLTATGRLNTKLIPSCHLVEAAHGRGLRISGESWITETDIAVLLQAKAAIGAGIETLLETAAMNASKISRVYLAGGFGMYLNVNHAIAAGLLPGFREEQVRVVGNTALGGAMVALRDRTALQRMETLRSEVEVLELNLQEEFEDRFIDHLMLP